MLCGRSLDSDAVYTPRRVHVCAHCGRASSLSDYMDDGQWTWKAALVERLWDDSREVDTPTSQEVSQATDDRWTVGRSFGQIPESRETRVLLRHGFTDWGDLYPRRQAFILETLMGAIRDIDCDDDVRESLRLAVAGSAEMAGHLSRWDRWYLKPYEAMAGHRFNFTTLSAEPNVWGSTSRGRGSVERRIVGLAAASDWMRSEIGTIRVSESNSVDVRSATAADLGLAVALGDSACINLPTGSIDLVITDPPYHDDVEYETLSRPLQEWLDCTILPNGPQIDYRETLLRVFEEVHRILGTEGAMILSFANRDPLAWADFLSALEEAGFFCRGFQIVHAENETDHAKRGRRACNYDLLLDLTKSPTEHQFVPAFPAPNDLEAQFVFVLGSKSLELGFLGDNWEDGFASELRRHPFLRPRSQDA